MGYYNGIRIPRKLKKQVKQSCGSSWNRLDTGQRLWVNLGAVNLKHRNHVISEICKS